jgi:hypothetical protein
LSWLQLWPVRDESTRRHRCHPRARTGTATDGAIDHIQTPPRVDLKALHERTSRDGKLTEAWITCKIEVAKGLARKTTEPTETILQASFGACSREEEALRLSFAEGRMPPAAIDDILTRARQKSREQLSVIILAIRQGVPPDEPLPIRTPVSQ